MNDHWNVLCQVTVFYADRKSKMAATAGHRLTLDPTRKCSNAFFSETTWTIETKLPMNDHWNVLYQVTVFYADRISKMATTAGHRLTLDTMGKCECSLDGPLQTLRFLFRYEIQMPSSQKLQI